METTNQTKWLVDPAHSEITFKVKHLMITNVKGEFRNFTAEAFSEGTSFIAGSINVKIDASSIFTNNNDRDNHLKSADFFDVENFKELTFTGSSLEKTDEDEYLLKGMLNMKGFSNEVSLAVEFGGINKDPWGNEKAGFSISGKLNRKDWGLTWNAALETGGVLVSDEVKLNSEIQLVRTN
jgi:polyisoprenoid-binding protein YceI